MFFLLALGFADIEVFYKTTGLEPDRDFEIYGMNGSHYIRTTYSDDGYRATLRIGSSEVHPYAMQPVTLQNVTLETDLVHLDTKNLQIIFKLTNMGSESKIINLAVDSDVMIDDDDHAAIRVFGQGRGFYMTKNDNTSSFRFTGKSHPAVTDIDTYWFGYWNTRYNYIWTQTNLSAYDQRQDSGMAFSWQNRFIPAMGQITFSVIIGLGEPTIPPDLNMTNSNIRAVERDGVVVFSGILISANPYEHFTIFLTFDETNHSIVIADNWTSGVSFNYTLNLTAYNIPNGNHTFSIWARDSGGGLSNAGTLRIEVFTSEVITLDGGFRPINELETSITVNGNGEIGRRDGNNYVPVELNDIRVQESTQVIAHGLTISRSLTISGTGNLIAAEGDEIRINVNTQIVFNVIGMDLPHLGLGQVSRSPAVPTVFQINLQASFTMSLENIPLVSAHPFESCEEWRNTINIPLNFSIFGLECRNTRGRSKGLNANEEQSLVIYRVSGSPAPTTPPKVKTDSDESGNSDDKGKGLSHGALIGIIVGAIVIVAIIGLTIFFVYRSKVLGKVASGEGSP